VLLRQPETQQLADAARQLRLPTASIITAAAARSIAVWCESESVLFDFTGVGRDPVFDSAALHRSVGYFSTIHPVLLRDPGSLTDPAAVRQVHHALQAAPLSGCLYGLVRHLHPAASLRQQLAELPQAEVKLNYHGRQPLCSPGNPLQQARLQVPHTLAPADSRRYLLNLEIGYRDEQLVTTCKYAGAVFRRTTIQRLLDDYSDQLRNAIQVVGQPDALGPRV
jgi:non-ribosomal peptide synthase protein (TIGR01720 family)